MKEMIIKANETTTFAEIKHKDIIFITNNKERLRMCENGDFLVNKKKITSDLEVYKAFKQWLKEIENA